MEGLKLMEADGQGQTEIGQLRQQHGRTDRWKMRDGGTQTDRERERTGQGCVNLQHVNE